MKHPSDVSAQLAFIGLSEDDKRWKAEKARKRKAAKPVPRNPIPDGPCCLRCRHWEPPLPGDEFGACQKLVTVMQRVARGPERGTTLGIEDVSFGVDYEWEFMRTRPSFLGCSRFAQSAKAQEETAA